MTTTPFTAFALPTDPGYFNYAACVNVGSTVRFYDDTDINGFHGNAICADDCIQRNKNSILQVPSFTRGENYGSLSNGFNCDQLEQNGAGWLKANTGFQINQLACSQAMKYTNYFIDTFDGTCLLSSLAINHEDRRRIYEQFSDYARMKLFKVLFKITSIPSDYDFGISDKLYNPLTDGPLIDKNNQDILTDLANFRDNFTQSVNLVGDIFLGCLTSDTTQESNNINYCRNTYSDPSSYNSTIVGTDIPLATPPSTRDKISSMGTGCLYALQFPCPTIQTLCSSGQLKGSWEFGLGNPAKVTVPSLYSKHVCRNYNQHLTNSTFFPFLDTDADPNTSPYVITAFDPGQSIFLNSSGQIEQPAALANYIYRSCDLISFGDDKNAPGGNSLINCCANDFADLNGGSLFVPGTALPPKNRPPTLNGQDTNVFFNFDYAKGLGNGGAGEQYGTVPYYARCFTQNGYTCPLSARDITLNDCPQLLIDHCFGNPTLRTTNTSLPASWALNSQGSGECAKWIGRAIYGGNSQWLNFIDVVGRRDVLPSYIGTQMLSTYLNTIIQQIPTMMSMNDVAAAGKDGIIPNEFVRAVEPIFFTLYKSYNLSIYDNGWLAQQCAPFQASEITSNPLLRQWCGCLLNPDIYSTLYPGISSECTPFCNSSDVIQTGTQCTGSSCIIDNITINIINSTTGNISISQFCNTCAQNTQSDTQSISQKCQCLLGAGIDITAIQSKVGDISLSQLCDMSNS